MTAGTNDTLLNANSFECPYAEYHVLSIVFLINILSFIILSVIMLSVVNTFTSMPKKPFYHSLHNIAVH